MRFDPHLAEIRFGCGLSPDIAPPRDLGALLAQLGGADEMATRFPIEPFDVFRARMVEVKKRMKRRKKIRGTPEYDVIQKELKLIKKDARQAKFHWLGQSLLRRTYTAQGFRERLVAFWADHFTAHGKTGVIKRAMSPYIEEAIRPRISGRFSDLLIACVTHPVMLHYLDQHVSMGPNSRKALKRAGKGGMNENLAREVLELHTLGVDGPYTQNDVRQLAELFTGMSFQAANGFKYRKDFAEPGAETVLGQTYSETASMRPIRDVLEDLAVHPSTARYIARKLAVHFVSDTPDPSLVDHLETRFLATSGDLMSVYEALLEHPAAWKPELCNVKWPVEFVGSAMRALAVPAETIDGLSEKQLKRGFVAPMAQMGQVWQIPAGPDGWPEEDSHWITPQGLSARIQWAMAAPERLVRVLPDPRVFVETALGNHGGEAVRFAAGAAESKSEAIGLVLSSPAFQRR